MKLAFATAAALALLAPAGAALASSDEAICGNAPHDQWMSEDALKARAADLGYDVRGGEADDGCYEIHAVDKNGARLEIYFNPVSGEVVRSEVDD